MNTDSRRRMLNGLSACKMKMPFLCCLRFCSHNSLMAVFPKSHNSGFSHISPRQIESVASILRDVLQRLDHTLGGPPYNLSLQDRPLLRPRAGYWNTIEDDFHWHLEILPQIARITGFEWASGFF